MTTTPDTLTFTWDPSEIQTAIDNHQLFLQGGELSADQLDQLRQLSPKLRRAARTIAEISMPPVMTVPADAGDCPRLPAADAVVVQSSIETWSHCKADDGIELASEHLADLGRLYDLSSVFSGDQSIEAQLIACAVLDTFEADRVARRLAQLLAAGEGDTAFARGLAELMAHHSWRALMADAPTDDIVHWRRHLGLHPEDFARTSEIDPARLQGIEAGTAQPSPAETRRLAEAIHAKRRETAAHA